MANEVKVTKDLENKKLIIEREFDGSKEKVWKAYADKELFEKWWGPQGWETAVKEFDFKPGGRLLYGMKCVDETQTDWFGKTEWGLMDIQEVDEGNSFTYEDNFADEEGNVKEGMPVLKITNEFVDLGNGRSKLVSTAIADSAEQIEQLVQMGMIDGFTSQLQKLDELVA